MNDEDSASDARRSTDTAVPGSVKDARQPAGERGLRAATAADRLRSAPNADREPTAATDGREPSQAVEQAGPPRRVMVVGCAGAGKSTVTVALNRAYGLPIVHLDRLYWKPGWVRSADNKWELVLRDLIAQHTWIHDGNYDSTMNFRLPRADLVVFVDTPRRRCLYRAIKRRIVGNKIHDIPGCPENIDREFLTYVWNFPKDHRVKLLAKIAGHPNVVRLRTRREVRRFLAGLAAPSPG